MKLLLTSAGLISRNISDAFLSELSTPVTETRILVVAYAQNEQEEFYVNATKQELENLGFKDIVIANMHNSMNVSELGNFNVIYVCGGNTFAILNKLRETGLFDFISSQVNQGAIYLGVSAGSIIACPTIDIAGWGSEADKNDIGLKDLKGFNFINISIFPHFKESLRNEIEEYKKKVQHSVYELTDDEAVFISRDQIKKII